MAQIPAADPTALDRAAQRLLSGQEHILEQIALGASLDQVLGSITALIEAHDGGIRCSILLLDASRQRLHGAAVGSLPADYSAAIDGMEIGPNQGSCGRAAYLNQRVITEDITTHPNWITIRSLVIAHGFRSCWSEPIRSRDGNVLGTFAIYLNRPQVLGDVQVRLIEGAARLAGIAVDREHSDRTLRESERRYHALAETAPVGIFHTDRAGNVVYTNSRAEELAGIPRNQLLANGWMQCLHPEDRNIISQQWSGAFARGEPVQSEFRFMRSDGGVAWVAGQSRPIIDEAGRVVGFVATMTDISASKQAEEHLRSMTTHARCILWRGEVLSSPGWDNPAAPFEPTLFQWHIVVQDEHAAQQVLPLEIPPGHTYFIAWAASRLRDDEVRIGMNSWSALRSGADSYQQEFRSIDCNGNLRWLHEDVSIQPMAYGHWRVFGVVTDITDRKRVEEELRQARDAAEGANRAKDHFLAMLSHELRTPLTPVLATVNLVEARPDLPGGLRSELDTIRRNVEMEARLIDDLLDLTRINRGKVELRSESVDAIAALKSALQICQGDIEAKELSLSLDVQAKQHHVWADPARLQQVFWNLLKNGIKFTPPGGSIAIHLRDDFVGDKPHLLVEISDTGIGIEVDMLPRLFDAFEQGERTITRQFGGLGLGLTISKALVEMQGGTLVGRSDGKDKGATFVIALPTSPAPVVSPKLPQCPQDAATRAGLTILLIEDHVNTLRVMTRLLRSTGYRVLTAGTVADAMRVADSESIHLIISDLGLPDGSGTDVMRELRNRPGLKGIALSGFGMDEDIRKSEEAGFQRHLTKPVNFQLLVDAIGQVLG